MPDKYIITLNKSGDFYYRKIKLSEIKGLSNFEKYNLVFDTEDEARERMFSIRKFLLQEEKNPKHCESSKLINLTNEEVEDILNTSILTSTNFKDICSHDAFNKSVSL